jgi:ribosomal protein S18 acetylase RimI-like enzyme
MQISQLTCPFDLNFAFPKDFSFFEPYLQYHLKEVLEIGGEVYTAKTEAGMLCGIFIYDGSEKSGTIYTQQREVFEFFYALKPFNYLFSELQTELENEIYDIYTINFESLSLAHRFSYEISLVDSTQEAEIERFMALTHPRINKNWVHVALKSGERCFSVRLDDQVAGLGWVSLVNGIGRLHSLFVKPQFRRMGIGEDILNARLLWLKANHAYSAFCEISRLNVASAKNVMKAQMSVSKQVYQYFQNNKNNKKVEKS